MRLRRNARGKTRCTAFGRASYCCKELGVVRWRWRRYSAQSGVTAQNVFQPAAAHKVVEVAPDSAAPQAERVRTALAAARRSHSRSRSRSWPAAFGGAGGLRDGGAASPLLPARRCLQRSIRARCGAPRRRCVQAELPSVPAPRWAAAAAACASAGARRRRVRPHSSACRRRGARRRRVPAAAAGQRRAADALKPERPPWRGWRRGLGSLRQQSRRLPPLTSPCATPPQSATALHF